MLRTALTELLNIDHPVIQAGMGPYGSATLAAAVSNAGGLGTVSSYLRTPDEARRQFAMIGDLTARPFAANHVVQAVSENVFQFGLDAKPRLVSMALADPGDFVKRAHDAGALFMHQVTTVAQAEQAAERGVDIIVAQGWEAGGYGGFVSTMVLVPQVVDAVRPVPVVAAGGIYDGRGLAAALVLGAAGVNIGTRFLASVEAPVDDGYREAITRAASEDTTKVETLNDIFPTGRQGYGTVLRSIKTPLLEEWEADPERVRREAEQIRSRMMQAGQAGKIHEIMPTAGQTAGGIHEVLPAGEIVRRIVQEAEESLRRGLALRAAK